MPTLMSDEQRQRAVELMQTYVTAPAGADGEKQADKDADIDRRRVELLGDEVRPLVDSFLSGQTSLSDFKKKLDGINKRNDDVWGFNGTKGQMFFNLLFNAAVDKPRLEQELKSAIAVPADEVDASSRIKTFANYVEAVGKQHLDSGGSKPKRPKADSATFFLSYFWQIQDRNIWPIYYTASVKVMADSDLWHPTGDGATDYIAYKQINEELVEAFTEASGQQFNFYKVEHVFWFKEKAPSNEGEKPAKKKPKPEPKPESKPEPGAATPRYWWLNAKPKVWDLRKLPVGGTQTYSTLNEQGHPRRVFSYFKEVSPGDVLIGYVTSPAREIVATCEITQGLHDTPEGQRIEFKKIEAFSSPVGWDELKDVPELEGCEPFVNNTGSLFKLTEDQFAVIRAMIDEKNPPGEQGSPSPYTRSDALAELFLTPEEFDDIVARLKRKKNVILQGPPGVGKTFVARRLAYAMMGVADRSRVEVVQFHQSYSYEDFIQGFRPREQGGFSRKDGIFYKFCARAQGDLKNDYFFVIDEINRGNLAKIFGELMMLLEHDKRGEEHAMPLTYSTGADERFYIPENLHIIGTMNTADRSLSLVDYALRRRFAFADLKPKFDSEKFEKTLRDRGAPQPLIGRIRERIGALNDVISADTRNLGAGYQIGHSYFCPVDGIPPDDRWFGEIVESEVRPLLEEYWIDEADRVAEQVEKLLA